VSEFSNITAFRLVRRLAIGQNSTSMYLLLCEEADEPAIEDDLRAEVEVQLGTALPLGRVSDHLDTNDGLGLPDSGPIRALWIDKWSPDLIAALDTHVVRLERTGAQFLFITSPILGEQLVIEAPNFRNRLTEVLRIIPDAALEGAPH
jgi:hypothetical protein